MLSEAKFVFSTKRWVRVELPLWLAAHVVRCQGKCHVYSPCAQKDTAEALPTVISFCLRVSAKLLDLLTAW